MIRIGVIGAGVFGEQHAKAIGEQPNAKVVAASRTSPKALKAFTSQFGGRGYTDYHDLLADPEVDAVVIATPHHLHTQITIDVAQAGKHILLEKPMAPTLDECDQILKAVADSPVTFMVGHNNHFAPAYVKAKEILESGEMGEIVVGTSTMSKPWWAPNRRDWHLDRRTGGGMWMTIGVHAVDRLMWLVNSSVRSVSAMIDTRFHDQQADDVGMAFLRFENGAAGTVTTAGYKTGVTNFSTELTCTRGILRIDKTSGVFIGREETWQRLPDRGSRDWMADSLVNEWEAFITAVESGETPPVTGQFARAVMQVIFAAEESAKVGEEVILHRT